MSEQYFNRFVRKLSRSFAFVGLLYGGFIIVLQLFGILDLPIWQQITLLVVPPLVASAFGSFLVRQVREERVRDRREKRRIEKEKSRNIFDETPDQYRGHGGNW